MHKNLGLVALRNHRHVCVCVISAGWSVIKVLPKMWIILDLLSGLFKQLFLLCENMFARQCIFELEALAVYSHVQCIQHCTLCTLCTLCNMYTVHCTVCTVYSVYSVQLSKQCKPTGWVQSPKEVQCTDQSTQESRLKKYFHFLNEGWFLKSVEDFIIRISYAIIICIM